jgi:hypothetical protein
LLLLLTIMTTMTIVSSSALHAQQMDMRGTKFYLSFALNYDGANLSLNPLMAIRLVGTSGTNVKLTFKSTGTSQTVTIPASGMATFQNNQADMYTNNEGKGNKSVLIESDNPILVYALNHYATNGSLEDATNVLPVEALGTEYFHLGRKSDPPKNLGLLESDFKDQYLVIATKNGTKIYEGSNTTPVTTLNEGEVYLQRSANDMTGLKITSSEEIAYFSCHSRCAIQGGGDSDGNNLFQQLMPTNLWGKEFFVPVSEQEYELVRIVASKPNTILEYYGGTVTGGSGNGGTGNQIILSQPGNWVELGIRRNGAVPGLFLKSLTNSVQVGSYMVGIHHNEIDNKRTVSNGNVFAKDRGGESLCLIPSLEQMVKNATVAPYYSSPFSSNGIHKVIIITKTASKYNTKFTKKLSSGQIWQNTPNAPISSWYSAVTISDIAAQNTLATLKWYDYNGWSYCDLDVDNKDGVKFDLSNPDGMIALGYGYCPRMSYYYSAYAATRDLTATFTVTGNINGSSTQYEYSQASGRTYCGGQFTFQASFDATPSKVEWWIDGNQVGGPANFTDSWTSNITAAGSHTVVLKVWDANNKQKDYSTTFTVASGGSIATPHMSSSPAMPVCDGTPVTFTATPSGMTSYEWKVNGSTVTGTGNQYTYAPANNDVVECKITLTGSCGTSSVTVQTSTMVRQYQTPTVNINTSTSSVCAGTAIQFTSSVNNIGVGTATYKWKVNGSDAPGTNNQSDYTYSSPANGAKVSCVVTVTGGICLTSSTATSNEITVAVYQNQTPTVNINTSTSSVCAGTAIQFTSSVSDNGGGTSTYKWKVNGSDAPGTNNQQVYTYLSPANGAKVTCIVTLTGGSCLSTNTATSNEITINVTQQITPTVNINVLSNPVCAGEAMQFTSSVSNTGGGTLAYKWKVNGSDAPGTNDQQDYTYNSPVLNGAKVTCIITVSGGSCLSASTATSNEITTQVIKYQLPLIDISTTAAPNMVTASVCAGTPILFTSQVSNTGGGTWTYKWKINGYAAPGTNDQPDYTYLSPVDGADVSCEITITGGSCLYVNAIASNIINVSVTQYQSPTVNIVSSTNQVCIGTSAMFTANVTNEGATPSYQWYVNGQPVGGNSQNYGYTPAAADVVTCEMTSSLACVNPQKVMSNSITVQNCVRPVDDYLTTPKNTTLTADVGQNDALFPSCTAPVYSIVSGNVPTSGTAGFAPNSSILYYTPFPATPAFTGLDSLTYEVACNGTAARAKVYIFVYDPSALQYIACENAVVRLGFKPQTGVTYNWYNANGVLLQQASDIYDVVKSAAVIDTVWAEPRFNGKPVGRILITVIKNSNCGGSQPAGCSLTGTLLWKEDFDGYEDGLNPLSPPYSLQAKLPNGMTTYNFANTDAGNSTTANSILKEGNYALVKYGVSAGQSSPLDWPKQRFKNDHTTADPATGRMLLVNGRGSVDTLYRQTIAPVCEDMTLYFSFWVRGCDAKLKWTVRSSTDNSILAVFVMDSLMQSSNFDDAVPWKQYGFPFKVPTGVNSVWFDVYNDCLLTGGNDFAIDDIEVHLCTDAVQVLAPSSADTTICTGNSLTLKAGYNDSGNFTANGNQLVSCWYVNTDGSRLNDPAAWTVIPGTVATEASGITSIVKSHVIPPFTAANTCWYRFAVASSAGAGYNCQAMSAIIRVQVDEMPVAPDIRLFAQPAAGTLVLNSYLDSMLYSHTVDWQPASRFIDSHTGKIDVSTWNNFSTHVFSYSVNVPACGTSTAKVYLKTINSAHARTDTVYICKNLASSKYVNLNRIIGIEAAGAQWITVNDPDNIAQNNVSPALAIGSKPKFFDAVTAFNLANTAAYSYGAGKKKFEFEYYNSAGIRRKVVLIIYT